ncbi:MAG: Maf family protein [Actinomycetota bacterium]|nr:Maf family protein [Actinomycetota bacterium]
MRFVLASESARRVDILRRMGYDFETRKSGFPEVVLADPKETVEANARGKALAVAEGSGEVVLAADTIVYLPDLPTGERVLGQARSEEDVRRMLESLGGRLHEVHSAVALVRKGELEVRHVVTKVRIRSLGEEEIQGYARLGEGVGKAGGYAIQGRAALLVEWIGGDYTNVVGLPLALTSRMLAGFGIEPYY